MEDVLDPPIANVDHFLIVFSIERPKVEPFWFRRFLVEAESAEILIRNFLEENEPARCSFKNANILVNLVALLEVIGRGSRQDIRAQSRRSHDFNKRKHQRLSRNSANQFVLDDLDDDDFHT
ncbi:Small ribosomal subunit biogenesis GTPase RsgA 1, mitochondrial-like protein [Drosera capensis]